MGKCIFRAVSPTNVRCLSSTRLSAAPFVSIFCSLITSWLSLLHNRAAEPRLCLLFFFVHNTTRYIEVGFSLHFTRENLIFECFDFHEAQTQTGISSLATRLCKERFGVILDQAKTFFFFGQTLIFNYFLLLFLTLFVGLWSSENTPPPLPPQRHH